MSCLGRKILFRPYHNLSLLRPWLKNSSSYDFTFLLAFFHLVKIYYLSPGRLLITSLRQRGLQRTTGSLAGVRVMAQGPGHRNLRRLWSPTSPGLALLASRRTVSALLWLQSVQECRRRGEDCRRYNNAGNVTQ